MVRARVRWLVVACYLGGLAAAWPAEVLGGDPEAQAREAWRRGNRAFAQQRYPLALEEFTKGYELSKRPRFLLNMAHALRKMGELREALAHYKRFLGSDPKDSDREVAEEAVVEVERAIREEEDARRRPVAEPLAAPTTLPPPVDPGAVTVTDEPREGTPLYKRWYVWAAVAAVVVGGVATALVLSSGDDARPYQDEGSLGAVRF